MNGIARYRAARKVMSGEALLLALLRESVLCLSRLEQAPANDPRWIPDLHRVRAILTELRDALVFDTAPELCASLARTYGACLTVLVRAGSERSADSVRPVRKALETLLEGWQVALTPAAAAAK